MSSIKDGGPAFHCVMPNDERNKTQTHYTGMSLRDYFAAKAMTRYLDEKYKNNRHVMIQIAELSYEMADAMIAARERQTEGDK